MQATLTPAWMGLISWVDRALWVLAGLSIFVCFGWLWTAAFLVYSVFGLAMLDVVLPFPSYAYCFRVIRQSLKRDILACVRHYLSASITGELDDHRERTRALTELAKAVDDIEADYLGKKHLPK